MCGRYHLDLNNDFYNHFGIVNRLPSFPKNTTVSPGDIEPIITYQQGLTLIWVMKWGMIPYWAKERGVGSKMFNVRAESLVSKRGFRRSFMSQRCLVPANGFYEWKTENSKKISYYVEVENRPLFAFAGVYDIWEEPVSGHEVYSYSIITTDSNNILKPIHPRMPVILTPEQEKLWLNNLTPISRLKSLLLSSSTSLTVNVLT